MTLPEPYYATPDGKVALYAGHVLDVLREMPAESVNCVVTSPPYWSLRKYDCEPVIWGGTAECEHEWETGIVKGECRLNELMDKTGMSFSPRKTSPDAFQKVEHQHATCRLCGAFFGQYGLEPTPELYVEHTLMWLREVKRVLRKDGTCWVNCRDGYAGSSGSGGPTAKQLSNAGSFHKGKTVTGNGLKAKDAVLMPFRVALAAQADGWWVRSVIIWAKPNPMPESVRDRPTDAHEYIFLLTKSARYFYDAEAIREKQLSLVDRKGIEDNEAYAEHRGGLGALEGAHYRLTPDGNRNCRSVWTFPTQGFPDAHFAVFPRELPERCIKAGCPEWVCPKCGKARVRVTERTKPVATGYAPGRDTRDGKERFCSDTGGYTSEFETLGWTDCGCGEGFVGGVVLDPFAGSGTTCEVAYHLGRTAWGIDASAKYLDMAIERVKQGALL